MPRIRASLALGLSLFLGTSLFAINHSAGFLAVYKVEPDAATALRADGEWAEIVVANPRALLGKIVAADLMVDDRWILAAKNGTYSVYRVKPGKHTVTALSGIVEYGTLDDAALEKLRRGEELEKKERIRVEDGASGLKDRQFLADWTSAQPHDFAPCNDLLIHVFGKDKGKNIVVLEPCFLKNQPERPLCRNFRMARRAGKGAHPAAKRVFAYLAADVDLAPGSRVYFTVVERAYICGPILRETDAAAFDALVAKKESKESEPLWSAIVEPKDKGKAD